MIEIGMNQIVKSFGFQKILNGACLAIHTGERAAIVGRNGTGKSTLLKLIGGEETADSGEISLRRGASVGMLEQIPRLKEPGKTVEQVLLEQFSQVIALERELRKMEKKMAHAEGSLESLMACYAEAQEQYAALGGYEQAERTAKIVQGFRLGNLLKQEYNVLSGGQKTVVNLAAVVLREPDILLLDEPTNHLDVKTLEWFEGFLAKYRGTIVMVSHDRWFLDRAATRIIWLEQGTCVSFAGNYSFAKQERERLLLLEFEQYKNQQKKIEAMRAAIRRYRDWAARGDNEYLYRKAKELERRLEKLEELERPQLERQKLPIRFSGGRTGAEVLHLRGFSIAFGDRVLLEPGELLIQEREKVCLMGDNGTGKTTLLRAVLEAAEFHEQDSAPFYGGEIRLNPRARLGYIPQEIRFQQEKASVLEVFREECPCTEGQARNILARYFFLGADVFKRASALSGGEKVLLKLCILLQRQVNFLILDEPTNHIDIETRETLEEALREYAGTLLFVSHDRYFIEKTASRLVELRDHRLSTFEGSYAAFQEFQSRGRALLS